MMNLHWDVPAFLQSLLVMAKGLVGIFIVAGVIVLCVVLLNRLTRRSEKQ